MVEFVQVGVGSSQGRIGYLVGEDGCWSWVGHLVNGYAKMTLYEPKKHNVRVHRWMWERVNGSIPPGFECHHTCGNRVCVNPSHMELLTKKEHVSRHGGRRAAILRSQGLAVAAWRVRPLKTHCVWGHPLSGDNLYIRPSRPSQRNCMACRRRWSAEWAARNP